LDIGGTVISVNSEGTLSIGDSQENLKSLGVESLILDDELIFSDGTKQLTSAPRMYTNVDAENGLSLSDLKPGDYY
jgi:hypothetical protein